MGYGENLITSIVRIFLYFMVIIVILFSMLFLYNVNKSNTFVSQCNEIITRSGGLTKSAYAKCNQLSAKYYHNYYHVSVNSSMNRSPDDLKSDNKGFASDGTTDGLKNYRDQEIPFGHDATYYVYSDVPMYGHLNYHAGDVSSKPMDETITSAIRAGSQN